MSIVQQEMDKHDVVIGLEPYPTAEELKTDSAHVRFKLNTHKHSFTCWKHNLPYCRMCMPQLPAPETCITELGYDPTIMNTLIPVRKFPDSRPGHEVVPPPTPDDPDRPVDADDQRALGFGLARTSEVEQMQVETNEVVSSLLRCNTSLQPLVTPTQAKAAMFYTSKYCSKDPFELSTALSLFHQAQIAKRKYGSTASDAGTESRNAKFILQKVLNKIGNIEVSAQQAAASMLGNNSFFTTHKFRFVFI